MKTGMRTAIRKKRNRKEDELTKKVDENIRKQEKEKNSEWYDEEKKRMYIKTKLFRQIKVVIKERNNKQEKCRMENKIYVFSNRISFS